MNAKKNNAVKKIQKAYKNYNERWTNRIEYSRVNKNDYVTWKTPDDKWHKYKPTTLMRLLNLNTIGELDIIRLLPNNSFIDPYTQTPIRFGNIRIVRPSRKRSRNNNIVRPSQVSRRTEGRPARNNRHTAILQRLQRTGTGRFNSNLPRFY